MLIINFTENQQKPSNNSPGTTYYLKGKAFPQRIRQRKGIKLTILIFFGGFSYWNYLHSLAKQTKTNPPNTKKRDPMIKLSNENEAEDV